MPQETIAITTIIVTIAFLITIKTWKMRCEANKETNQSTRLFNHAKNEAIKAVKEQYKEDSDLYATLLKRRRERIESLDKKISHRQETLNTIQEAIANRQKDRTPQITY